MELDLFVVYNHPTDFPDFYIVRRWCFDNLKKEYLPDSDIFIRHQNIEWIRERLNHCGLVRTDRDKNDDPKILETWI